MPDPVNPFSNALWFLGTSDAGATKKTQQTVKKKTANVPPSTGIQPCPVKTAPKNNPANKTCNFASIKISKPKRDFDLVVDSTTPFIKRTIGIVAGFKNVPAKVSCELLGSVGPCVQTHNNKRSFDTGASTFKITSSSESKLQFDATSSNRIQIFPWGYTPDKYTIIGNRCGHMGERAFIEVYPDTETDIYIGFDFGEKKSSTNERVDVEEKKGNRKAQAANSRKGVGVLETTTTKEKSIEISKGLKVGGAIKFDNKEYKVDFIFKTTIETLKKISKVVDRAKVALAQIKGKKEAAGATQVFDSPVSLGIKLPVVELHVGGSWQEQAGSPDVNYEGKIKLAAEPLIGIFFEWNITSTVLQAIPGGVVFERIKKRFVDGFLELILKAGAEISGEIEIAIQKKEVKSVNGKIKGKIPIAAELVVLKADFDVWIAHATVEYKVGVESGFEIVVGYSSKAKVLNCEGGMLDLVIWWSSYHTAGAAKKNTAPNKYGSEAKTGLDGKHQLYKKTFDSKYEFFSYDFKKP